MAVLWIIIVYFCLGVVALGLFDLLTKRVRDNLRSASFDSQSVMTKAGVPLSARSAMIVTVVVMVLFWPAPIYGALSEKFGSEKSVHNPTTGGKYPVKKRKKNTSGIRSLWRR